MHGPANRIAVVWRMANGEESADGMEWVNGGGGRSREISVGGIGRNELMVIKGDGRAYGNVYTGAVARLRAFWFGQAIGTRVGKFRPDGSCSGAIPAGDGRVVRSTCVA